MFSPSSWRCCTTQSIASITWDTSVAPSAAATFTLTSRASGATPMKPSCRVAGGALSRPAMMPAMWVP